MAECITQNKTKQVTGLKAADICFSDWLEAGHPVIFKGAADDWPLLKAGQQSRQDAAAYLKHHYHGRPITGFVGAAEIKGRFGYNADMTGLNFSASRYPLDEFLDRILACAGDEAAPSYYIGSTDVDHFLPGLRDENDLPLREEIFAQNPPMVSIWIGNRTTAAAHFDYSNNIACNLVGHRRFTLFPPDQIAHLYPGPLEPTPAGQVVTMVDFAAPDLVRYPDFAKAAAAAQVADLEPGDILLYPALWWHQVDAKDDFNVMINYWWNNSAAYIDTPMNTLLHAILSLRDRPEQEKRAWKNLFDYYIFGDGARAAAHLPDHIAGPLAPMTDISARRLRAMLLSKLNR
ncbi:MAG: cupin-like domain-containing protein [Sphingomonadales bacterium]|nr:cupin-like domain-containing protein [Sphingomonadales bacterium]